MSLRPLLLVLCLFGCANLHIEPKGALDGARGDLLVLVSGLVVQEPPGLMVNAKRAAASFGEASTPEAVCAALTAAFSASGVFGRVECQPLSGPPAAFARRPGMSFRLGTYTVPLPPPRAKLGQGDFVPEWALILDSLYLGYEIRSSGSGTGYPVVTTNARVVWWSNAEGEPLAWGQDRSEVSTTGWVAPDLVASSVRHALDTLATRILRHAGLR